MAQVNRTTRLEARIAPGALALSPAMERAREAHARLIQNEGHAPIPG